MKIAKPDTIKLHFIIGSGRAGTTLLVHIFNHHKNCVSSPEIKHLLFFYRKYHNMTEVSADLIKDLEHYSTIIEQADDMSDYYNYSNSKFKLSIGEKINYFEFCKRVYFIFANHKSDTSLITTIIDKNPNYTMHVGMLNKLLPDAKFLCAVRDYRSYVLSNIQSPESYAKKLPIQYHSIVWMFYNKLVLEIKNKYENKVKIFLYEDFIEKKEKTFEDICIFFDVPFDVNCLYYQEKVTVKKEVQQIDQRTQYKRASVLKPINADRKEVWKETFTTFQLKIIEFWCGKTGEKFGYKKTKEITLIEKSVILIISLPYYLRVWTYFKLKSIKLNVFLSEGRRAKHFKVLKTYPN